MDRVRRLTGGSPALLVGLLLCFLVAGYAAFRLLGTRPGGVLLWLIGAALLHDLVLAPVYVLLDRAGRRRATPARADGRPRSPWPAWWNHVRFPAAFSLLLFLVWFPEITRRSPGYAVTTGLDPSVYLGRWLAVSGALFVVSALLLVAGRLRRRARG